MISGEITMIQGKTFAPTRFGGRHAILIGTQCGDEDTYAHGDQGQTGSLSNRSFNLGGCRGKFFGRSGNREHRSEGGKGEGEGWRGGG